jgi:DNA adenine methylase
MQYFGGKARIAKELAKELQSRLSKDKAFVDLFCGSCNVVSRIKAKTRIANDLHKELIAMHKAVQSAWIPPCDVSEEEYKEAKDSSDNDPLKAFIGFGCSFSGKYFGGYARGGTKRNYAMNASNSLIKKHLTLKDVVFTNLQYSDVFIPEGSLIYSDIPYKDTTAYSTGLFDHEDFYKWACSMKSKGHTILVSEYKANVPEGWSIEWEHTSKKDIRNKQGVQELTTEVLMSPV